MIDIGKDLQRAYDDGYEQGRRDAIKHGKWVDIEVEDISTKTTLGIKILASMWCNQCHRIHYELYYSKVPQVFASYCPYCGARMDGEENV